MELTIEPIIIENKEIPIKYVEGQLIHIGRYFLFLKEDDNFELFENNIQGIHLINNGVSNLQLKTKLLADEGYIKLASGDKVEVKIPPKFPGKSLSEYLNEIRE
jgi:hypothetical protein